LESSSRPLYTRDERGLFSPAHLAVVEKAGSRRVSTCRSTRSLSSAAHHVGPDGVVVDDDDGGGKQ
jgi:hypothetical protein